MCSAVPSGVLDSPLLLKWQEFGSHPGHGLCLSRPVGLGAAVEMDLVVSW